MVTQIMIVYFNWPSTNSIEETNDAAGSIIGLIHSTTILPALIIAFMKHQYNPSEQLIKAQHKWWQNYVDSLLQFSTGYFIYDTIFIISNRCIIMKSNNSNNTFLIQLTNDDIMFIIHHCMTTTYITQSRYYQAGHMSAMMCMLLGEASNPLHNIYLISQIGIKLGLAKQSILIEITFSFVYLLFRVIIGPIVCIHMTYDLLINGRSNGNLPLWVLIFWNIMIWAVIFGSGSWIILTYDMLYNHYMDWMTGESTSVVSSTVEL